MLYTLIIKKQNQEVAYVFEIEWDIHLTSVWRFPDLSADESLLCIVGHIAGGLAQQVQKFTWKNRGNI